MHLSEHEESIFPSNARLYPRSIYLERRSSVRHRHRAKDHFAQQVYVILDRFVPLKILDAAFRLKLR